jgi:hypothetical protein
MAIVSSRPRSIASPLRLTQEHTDCRECTGVLQALRCGTYKWEHRYTFPQAWCAVDEGGESHSQGTHGVGVGMETFRASATSMSLPRTTPSKIHRQCRHLRRLGRSLVRSSIVKPTTTCNAQHLQLPKHCISCGTAHLRRLLSISRTGQQCAGNLERALCGPSTLFGGESRRGC